MAPTLVRSQMALALTTITYSDFPAKWPGLFPAVMANMKSGEEQRVMGALVALRVLGKRFEFAKAKPEQEALDKIVTECFPVLLDLLKHLVTSPQRVESFMMQKLICQVFWSATHNDIPSHLRKPTNFRPWMDIFTKVLQQPVDIAIIPAEEMDEAHTHPAWKTRKWIAECVQRLYERYGDPKIVGQLWPKPTVKFAERFQKDFAPKFLRLFLNLIGARNSGAAYQSPRVCNAMLQYCTLGIRYPNTYKVMKGQLQQIMAELILPFLCFSPGDRQLWDEDPAEFVRQDNDLMGEIYDPRTSAETFLTSLISKKGKDCLDMTMQYLLQGLTTYALQSDPAQKDYPFKDGALMAVGSIGPVLKKKAAYRNSLEDLLNNHVMMEFQNPVGFLRARACWVYGQFSDIKFRYPANLLAALECVVKCLGDPELAVRVNAALSLRKFLHAEQLTEQIRPAVPQLLEALFSLMNDIENEDLVSTLETVVESFPEQVAPLAVPCVTQLAVAFTSYADREDESENEDIAMAAGTCMETLSTLLLSVHQLPGMFTRLETETPLLQLLGQNLQPERVEYLEETLEVVKCLTFYSAPISDALWQLFPLLVNAWQVFGYDYLEEFMPCIESFITRSSERFCAAPEPKGMVLDMCRKVFQNEDASQGHCCSATQVMEAVFISCTGQADELVQPFIEMACSRLLNEGDKKTGPALRVMLLSVMMNACTYNPPLAIQAMESLGDGVTDQVLNSLLQNMSELARVHDKKVAILGLSSIVGIAHMPGLPPSLAESAKQLLETALLLLQQCQVQKEQRAADVAAQAAAEEAGGGEESEESEESEEEEDFDEEDDGDGDGDGDGDDEEDAENAEDARYLAMLNEMDRKVSAQQPNNSIHNACTPCDQRANVSGLVSICLFFSVRLSS